MAPIRPAHSPRSARLAKLEVLHAHLFCCGAPIRVGMVKLTAGLTETAGLTALIFALIFALILKLIISP